MYRSTLSRLGSSRFNEHDCDQLLEMRSSIAQQRKRQRRRVIPLSRGRACLSLSIIRASRRGRRNSSPRVFILQAARARVADIFIAPRQRGICIVCLALSHSDFHCARLYIRAVFPLSVSLFLSLFFFVGRRTPSSTDSLCSLSLSLFLRLTFISFASPRAINSTRRHDARAFIIMACILYDLVTRARILIYNREKNSSCRRWRTRGNAGISEIQTMLFVTAVSAAASARVRVLAILFFFSLFIFTSPISFGICRSRAIPRTIESARDRRHRRYE